MTVSSTECDSSFDVSFSFCYVNSFFGFYFCFFLYFVWLFRSKSILFSLWHTQTHTQESNMRQSNIFFIIRIRFNWKWKGRISHVNSENPPWKFEISPVFSHSNACISVYSINNSNLRYKLQFIGYTQYECNRPVYLDVFIEQFLGPHVWRLGEKKRNRKKDLPTLVNFSYPERWRGW